jgi:hypothetical protein
VPGAVACRIFKQKLSKQPASTQGQVLKLSEVARSLCRSEAAKLFYQVLGGSLLGCRNLSGTHPLSAGTSSCCRRHGGDIPLLLLP